jgi:pimeloyl-ACP methyl ester carboxylesterase
MAPPFEAHLVRTVSGRHVGVRRGGEGPPVALLHESPRSSAALLPLVERLAARFTVYAFDNPGFGLSDELPSLRPAAECFADALIESFDALGLRRVPVYGTHTGAVIAMAAGIRHPDRISALALDGYPVFSEAEQEELLASYLAPITPAWDGTHLAWLWGRVKDQFTFFPWNRRGRAARIPRPLASLDTMQAVVVDFLMAGDRYRAAYASAFRYEPVGPARQVTVPTAFLCRSDDLLFSHLDRLPPLAEAARVVRLGPDRQVWADAVGDALAVGASGTAPPVPALPLGPGRALRRAGEVVVATRTAAAPQGADRPALVVLPDIPGAAAALDDLARALASVMGRPVTVIDLPGFGASRAPGAASPDDLAAAIRGALDLGDVDVVATGASAAIGAALGRRTVAIDPVPDQFRGSWLANHADITPRLDGAHLLAAWHQLRDTEIWRPWFDRRPETARDVGTDPDPARLQAVLAAWMMGGDGPSRATLAAALSEPLPADRVRVAAADADPWRQAEAVAAAFGPE